MIRPSLLLLFGLLAACGGHRRTDAAAPQRKVSPESTAAQDDSVRAIVQRYEGGGVALEDATRLLADLIEPTGGFAVGGQPSAKATELFESTRQELRRRDAKRLRVADSLVTR